jgi:hypothetical protein
MKQVKYIVLLSYLDNSDDMSREEVLVDRHSDSEIEHANAIEAAKRQKYIGDGTGHVRMLSPEQIWDEAKEYRVFACFPEYMTSDIKKELA